MSKLEKVLNQILEKLNNIESEQKEQGKKLTNLDSKVSNLDSKVTNMEAEQKEQGKKLNTMEKTLNYHSEMFGALIHAQETQKAQLDKLEIDLAKLSGEQQKSFETLINMYGRHEFEITQLKQVK
jgi:predicted  nucleic acid-binding Zn-ribbon protein